MKISGTPTINRLLGAGCVAIAIFVGVTGFRCIQSARQAINAERPLHAASLAIHVVADYIEINGNAPKSWDDLLATKLIGAKGSMFDWPKDADYVRSVVVIDFSWTIEDLATRDLTKYLDVREPFYVLDDRLTAISTQARAVMAQRKLHETDGPKESPEIRPE
jgi:hypothetical protein